jgi:GT2 family glycosyltransferase
LVLDPSIPIAPPLPSLSPRVLAVVLNWNRTDHTVECVESLLNVEYPGLDIAVCDNASDDVDRLAERLVATGTRDHGQIRTLRLGRLDRAMAEAGGASDDDAADVMLIQTGGNFGYAGGNNVGLRYALARGYDYVWVLNNDTVVAPDALSPMVTLMLEYRGLGIVGSTHFQYESPKMHLSLGGGPYNKWFGIDTPYHDLPKDPVAQLRVEHVLGASMLVRVEAIRDVGVMDESYFLYREETDWCFRMRAKHWDLATTFMSAVWHKLGGTVVHRSPTHDYYSTRNMLVLTKRFFPYALPSVASYTFVRAMLPKVARGQFKRIPFVWRAYVDFFRGVTGYVDLTPPPTASKTADRTVAGA